MAQNGTTNALLSLLRNHHRQSPRLPHSTCKKIFPYQDMIPFFTLEKRRHVCPECDKRFDERIDFLPRYRQFTNRVSMQIFEQLKECRSIKSIAVQNNMCLRQQPGSSMKSILKQASSLRFWLSMSSEEMQRARNSSVFSLIRRTGGS